MKVIAEVGSNWKTLDDCMMSIEKAKLAGADAVKFQFYNHQDMYGSPGVMKNELPYWWLDDLCQHAQKHNIEFMCTAFSVHGYKLVNEFVKTHKVASAEITDKNILACLAGIGKPVILSTGGAELDEIQEALEILGNTPTTIMFCVADYPAKIVDFRQLNKLVNHFGAKCDYGYSDHTLDVLNIPMFALCEGASVIEKHVNFTSHSDTPDAGHALNFDEFKLMIDHLDQLSTLEHTQRLCNQDMKKSWKRRLVSLPSGTIGYFRPLPK